MFGDTGLEPNGRTSETASRTAQVTDDETEAQKGE